MYSSVHPYTEGKILWDWLATKSFEEQFKFRIKQLEKFGTMSLEHGKWVFKPFD